MELDNADKMSSSSSGLVDRSSVRRLARGARHGSEDVVRGQEPVSVVLGPASLVAVPSFGRAEQPAGRALHWRGQLVAGQPLLRSRLGAGILSWWSDLALLCAPPSSPLPVACWMHGCRNVLVRIRQYEWPRGSDTRRVEDWLSPLPPWGFAVIHRWPRPRAQVLLPRFRLHRSPAPSLSSVQAGAVSALPQRHGGGASAFSPPGPDRPQRDVDRPQGHQKGLDGAAEAAMPPREIGVGARAVPSGRNHRDAGAGPSTATAAGNRSRGDAGAGPSSSGRGHALQAGLRAALDAFVELVPRLLRLPGPGGRPLPPPPRVTSASPLLHWRLS
jgi:hypothetical protein